MMETVLNVGLTDATLPGFAAIATERFALDSYRRFLQMFGRTVLDIEASLFEGVLDEAKACAGARADIDLGVADLERIVEEFKAIIERQSGRPFPQDPFEQLFMSIVAVFNSWNAPRAVIYRNTERIAHDLGTAVNVGAMVFDNLNDRSASGVAFTRDPATGARGVYGDFLINAQGEDVVAGIRNTLSLPEMQKLLPENYRELTAIMETLEKHYRDLCDIEFTIESGKLWMLQTRVGKRTAAAAFRIATALLDEGVISENDALLRVTGDQLSRLMFPAFDPGARRQDIARRRGGARSRPHVRVRRRGIHRGRGAARGPRGRAGGAARRRPRLDRRHHGRGVPRAGPGASQRGRLVLRGGGRRPPRRQR